MNKQIKGFVDFVREQGVVGLAVGLAIGVAAGAAVKEIVDGFVSPIIAFLLGGNSISEFVWETGITNGDVELVFGWGAIVDSIIVLLATAAVIYYLVKGLNLDKLDKKSD